MYTNFIATVTLVYFVLENPDNSSSQDILKDAMQGKDMLTSLARKSMAADRSAQTLTVGCASSFTDLSPQSRANGFFSEYVCTTSRATA